MTKDDDLAMGDTPISQPEPRPEDDTGADGADPGVEGNIWLRGLFMVILALMFAVAETVLIVAALVQFGWMLFAKERNTMIAGFGDDLGRWLARVAAFQTGQTEDKPFPWDRWGR